MYKQFGVWLLLGYLVLLLNLGHSMHRAIIPHFHQDASDSVVVQSGCSCCLHSSPVDPSESVVYANLDCSICKFFQNYHVTICSASIITACETHRHQEVIAQTDPMNALIPHVARGPPAI